MIDRILIGIGAPKAGSTYLYKLLSTSPDICLPSQSRLSGEKEINFFSNAYQRYRRGIDWYESLFEECRSGIACDVSPSYFSDPAAPARISNDYPAAHLVALVRDPVARAFSAYQHHKRALRVPPSATFSEAAEIIPTIIGDSRYEIHINRYLRYFSRSQVSIIFLEELMAEPSRVLRPLLDSLDASAVVEHVPATEGNRAYIPKSYAIQRLMFWSRDLSKALLPLSWVNAIRGNINAGDLLRKINAGPPEQMPAAVSKMYSPIFIKTNEVLREIAGRERLPWE